MSRARAGRLAVAAAALVGGALAATATVLLHSYAWGLALGVATAVALLAAIPGGWWRRLPFAVGWCLTVIYFTSERPEGDLLIQADLEGYLLLGGAVVVLCGGVVGLVDRRASSGVVAESEAPTS
ncbi:hypothetical protein F0U44_11025 [Nocardioides humilatus]|uniref:Uncharacterized protein n=1 Tax=Nocardioides humilatus TaxID=2607660 RepID=A0A5B1LGR6_9ACTN|nr:DUF6113 family protein [Nocardioides humilatus]KAA1418990.1 hypothetical protein F0U44_11025 [Nocardioides humilatus]